jgi:hypothetical protein
VFNAVLRRQYFPSAWKHSRVVSKLKTGKDPTLSSFYRPISQFDTVGKLFLKILRARVLREGTKDGFLSDEHLGIRRRHSTTLQLARLVNKGNRNFDVSRVTGAVFLDVAKTFDTVLVKGLLYKITVLNVPSYLVKIISSFLDCRTFQTSFQSATSTCRDMLVGVAQGGLVFPVLFTLYVNDIPTPSHHVELAQYADDTALVAMPGSPSLLVGYLEVSVGRLERWLRDWRIAMKVSKSTALLFAKAPRPIQKPRTVQFLGEPRQWVDTARYFGVTLDTQLT